MILDVETIRTKLKEVEIMGLSRKLDLHFNTLYKIANGKADPSYKVLVKLSEYFQNPKDVL